MSQRKGYADEQEIRGALLGTGQVTRFQMDAWSKIPGVKIVALANRTVEKAYRVAEQYGISLDHVYSDYQHLLEKEEFDFVDIATAPHIHYQQVLDSARRGLHVFCQKPLASSLEEAREMMAVADQAGILFSVNENWRWRSWYREIKELLSLGTVGTPLYLRIERRLRATLPRKNGEAPELMAKQPYTADMENLIVYEWGIHLLDVIRFLFGGIDSVYARMHHVSPWFRGEDRAVILSVANQVDCVVDISWASIVEAERVSPLEYVVIEGDQGTIELLPQKGDVLRITTHTGVIERPAYSITAEQAYQKSYDDTQRHFIECLRSGKDPETVANDNYKTLEAVFAVYESYQCNQVVRLGE